MHVPKKYGLGVIVVIVWCGVRTASAENEANQARAELAAIKNQKRVQRDFQSVEKQQHEGSSRAERVFDMSLEGEYGSSTPYTGIRWRVKKGYGEGKYDVWLKFYDCLTSCAFKRIARYENGMLILDQTVIDNVEGNYSAYTRLFTVKVGKVEYLMPERGVTRLGVLTEKGFPRLLARRRHH